jgi:colanic acid/amylovoran biosynthesis glycosyltransferase
MRIAYLINEYPKVSHIFIRREILALERRGVEVMRIALRGWDGPLVDKEDELERKRTRYVLRSGAPVLLFSLLRMLVTRPRRLLRAFALACRMARRAERPLPVHLIYLAEACRIEPWLRADDIQHLHAHFGTNSAEVAMLVHELGGVQWSFTIHGPEEYDNVKLIGIAEKLKRCAFVVAVASYGRSQLYRLIDHQQWPKVKVVNCGLESDYFSAGASPVPHERRLVCVGRLCEQKGQLLLIEATHRLVSDGVHFELVLVGDGEMRSAIEALIKRHALQDRVRITGRISSEQLREEVLAARALVLPSFAEGLPMVIMEAMALGRPVISTFVAGIPELVIAGEHGWLVPAGNVEALADAMRCCLDAPGDALARMGEAAHKRVLARHNVDTQALELANLFDATVAMAKNSSLARHRLPWH